MWKCFFRVHRINNLKNIKADSDCGLNLRRKTHFNICFNCIRTGKHLATYMPIIIWQYNHICFTNLRSSSDGMSFVHHFSPFLSFLSFLHSTLRSSYSLGVSAQRPLMVHQLLSEPRPVSHSSHVVLKHPLLPSRLPSEMELYQAGT